MLDVGDDRSGNVDVAGASIDRGGAESQFDRFGREPELHPLEAHDVRARQRRPMASSYQVCPFTGMRTVGASLADDAEGRQPSRSSSFIGGRRKASGTPIRRRIVRRGTERSFGAYLASIVPDASPSAAN